MTLCNPLRAAVLGMLLPLSLAAAPAIAQKAPAPAATPAAALDPARVAAAKELIVATGGIEAAKKGMEQMSAAIMQQMRGQNPAQAEKFAGFMAKQLAPEGAIVKTYLDEVMAAFTSFYAGNFTVAELNEIKGFQVSATGKKFQMMAPQMMASAAGPMLKMQQSLMTEIQKDMKP